MLNANNIPKSSPRILKMGIFWRRLIPTLVFACILEGCATTPISAREFCATYKPILISHQDTLTDLTAQAILANNETYKKLCHK